MLKPPGISIAPRRNGLEESACPKLFPEPRQGRGRVARHRRAVDVDRHRDQHVVAVDGDEVGHALLAERIDRALVGRVADAVLACSSVVKS